MALLHIKILGRRIDDLLLFKLLLGGICVSILLLAIGLGEFSGWVLKSLVIWSGVTMIIVPLSYGFVNEELAGKHIAMVILGISIILFFGFYTNLTVPVVFISVIQSLVWMTVFSIILDGFKKRLQK